MKDLRHTDSMYMMACLQLSTDGKYLIVAGMLFNATMMVAGMSIRRCLLCMVLIWQILFVTYPWALLLVKRSR